MNKEVNEKKKRYAIIITFLVLMICITGGTYAYFALTASNNSVTGSVGGASLNLTVTKIYPTSEHNNKNMIPQLESTLDEAISLDHKCVDDNGNVICQVYSATVQNLGSSTSVLNGTISFEGIEREAGIYDDDWNLLASWDTLVNDYGLDMSALDVACGNGYNGSSPSLSYIVKSNNEFSTVSKIVIKDNVKVIGAGQMCIPSLTEVIIPEEVTQIGVGGNFVFSWTNNLKIYYNGNSTGFPWNATNATLINNIKPTKMTNLKWMRINNSNTLGIYESHYASDDKVLFEESKSFSSNGSETYYFVIWIDETGEVQNDSGTFRANINFESSDEGLTSTVRPLLTEHIANLYNNGSINTVNIADDETNQVVSLNSSKGLMYVNQGSTYGEEYRYYGISPNNYVEYNGELWRIISSSKVFSSESDTTGEQRVRLVKDTNVGSFPLNAGYTNNWTDATLMCQLNSVYYNDAIAACSSKNLSNMTNVLNENARGMIGNALWYLGGVTAGFADDLYSMERNNSGYTSHPNRWTGKVGILYPSDYMYASDLILCKKDTYNYSSDKTNCVNTNWLDYGALYWFISPNPNFEQYSYYHDFGGYISPVGPSVDLSAATFPVVVLNANVKVDGGIGTKNNPYKLKVD